jgi:hypothetical protein
MIDHLVYAVPDLDLAVDDLDRRLGVRAAPGGQHLGRGTHNALLALGPATYLEIVAPDPRQPAPRTPRWFGLDALNGPQLLTWAAPKTDLAACAARARARGFILGDVLGGARARPDGATLSWHYTDPHTLIADGLVPFLIDWGTSPHPAASAPSGLTLSALTGEHPEPDTLAPWFETIDVTLPIARAPRAALIATIQSPRGVVELR